MTVKLATTNGADVAQTNPLVASGPSNPLYAGFNTDAMEVHTGSVGSSRLVRPADSSPDCRKRVGFDQTLWQDTFNHTVLNTSKYKFVDTTMTKAFSGGKLVFNSSNVLASGNAVVMTTWRTFALNQSFPLYAEFEVAFSITPTANSVCEFGFGFVATNAAPTDGVMFRLNSSGQWQGVLNNNGTESFNVNLNFTFTANQLNKYLIVWATDRVEFWINDNLYGSIAINGAINYQTGLAQSLPLFVREYNSAAVSPTAQQMQVASLAVTSGDMNSGKLWATVQAGQGLGAYNVPDGTAAGGTVNYVNSTVPASATLSNTAAGYTTLGGQWQFAAVAGAETDYALFGFQVPAPVAALPGRNLVIRGVHIESFNMGAAVATTPHILQWALGVGSSAVTLAQADSTTAVGKARRVIPIGCQYMPIGSVIGYCCNALDINLDAPVYVEAGSWVHIILKMPVASATASQIVRGLVNINGYWE